MTLLIWLLALAVLFVAAAPYLPDTVPKVRVVEHFSLQAAIAAAVLLIVAIVARVYGGTPYLMLLAAYFLCVRQLWPFLLAGKKPVGEGAVLKVLQLNAGSSSHDTAALKKLILDEKPDIVAAAGLNRDSEALLRAMHDIYPYQHIGDAGVAVLGKALLEGVEQRFVAAPGVPAVFFKTRLGDKAADFIFLHVPGTFSETGPRDAAFETLAAWFEKEQPHHLVLTGDFNASPYTAALKTMAKRMNLRSARNGRGFFGTFPARLRLQFLRIPLDHLFVSELVLIEDFRTGAKYREWTLTHGISNKILNIPQNFSIKILKKLFYEIK